jgi:predicted GNAT family acetyltransferase
MRKKPYGAPKHKKEQHETWVEPKLRGQGVANELALMALEYAKTKN